MELSLPTLRGSRDKQPILRPARADGMLLSALRIPKVPLYSVIMDICYQLFYFGEYNYAAYFVPLELEGNHCNFTK